MSVALNTIWLIPAGNVTAPTVVGGVVFATICGVMAPAGKACAVRSVLPPVGDVCALAIYGTDTDQQGVDACGSPGFVLICPGFDGALAAGVVVLVHWHI